MHIAIAMYMERIIISLRLKLMVHSPNRVFVDVPHDNTGLDRCQMLFCHSWIIDAAIILLPSTDILCYNPLQRIIIREV